MVLNEAELLELCHQNRCNVDVLTGYTETGVFMFGVRLRPWKQNPRYPQMVLAGGKSLKEGLDNATQLAATDKWASLDWAARPWPVASVVGATWAGNAGGPRGA